MLQGSCGSFKSFQNMPVSRARPEEIVRRVRKKYHLFRLLIIVISDVRCCEIGQTGAR